MCWKKHFARESRDIGFLFRRRFDCFLFWTVLLLVMQQTMTMNTNAFAFIDFYSECFSLIEVDSKTDLLRRRIDQLRQPSALLLSNGQWGERERVSFRELICEEVLPIEMRRDRGIASLHSSTTRNEVFNPNSPLSDPDRVPDSDKSIMYSSDTFQC